MSTFYEEVGGTEFFEELVSGFYAVVAVDPILAPMYPDKDWHAAAERLQMFLEQYWGGPTDYQELRGHPRLRMRHNAFHIGPKARERWLFHMRAAVDSLALPPLQEAELWGYLDRAATAMLNSAED